MQKGTSISITLRWRTDRRALLTKDLPVLGVLRHQVKHVLGLHHLWDAERAAEFEHQASVNIRQRWWQHLRFVFCTKRQWARGKREREKKRAGPRTSEILHRAIRTTLSQASPRTRSLASGELRAKRGGEKERKRRHEWRVGGRPML